MLYLATITLAISFLAQFMINVEAHSFSALRAKKKFLMRNKRLDCPDYDACPRFVHAMQNRDKHVTRGKFPNYFTLFRKNFCAAGSTSEDIQCGGMAYTESVTLKGDLFCDGRTTSNFITMDGPDAILDCNGYKIDGSRSTVPRLGRAVRLINGASAINCPISNVAQAISIEGDGCSTVMNVDIAFTRTDSIRVTNSGTTVLDSIVIKSSLEDGIDVEGGDGTGLVIMSDITISGVAQDGLCLLSGGATVGLYGDIFIEGARNDGISFDGNDFAVTAYCSLTLFDNGEGIAFDTVNAGSFTFASDSVTTSCFNSFRDIEGTFAGTGGFVTVSGANVQCDVVAGAGSFDCNEDCVDLPSSSTSGVAPACLANEGP